ncbi:MAG: hypothetical protein ACPHVK_07140 [Akkermansiaceae bacterium]
MANHSDHSLPDELQELESQLSALMPSSICSELHAKLEKSMVFSVNEDDEFPEHVEEFESLELHLRQIAPATMPPNMLDRMVRAMDQWHEDEPSGERIISLDSRREDARVRPRVFGVGFYGAAAAVALFAGITAMFVSNLSQNNEKSLASKSPASGNATVSSPAVSSTVAAASGGLARDPYITPVSNLLSTTVINSKEGIVYGPAETAYRCVEVEYVDQVKVKSPDGRSVILSRPRKDRYFIPIKMH